MSNWEKYTLAAVVVMVAGFAYINGPHRNIPADLRDAMGESSAFGQLGKGAEVDVPAVTETQNTSIFEIKQGDKVQISQELRKRFILTESAADYKKRAFMFSKGKILSGPEEVDISANPAISGLVRINPENCVGQTFDTIYGFEPKTHGVALLFDRNSCLSRIDVALPSDVSLSNVIFEDFERIFGGHLKLVKSLK